MYKGRLFRWALRMVGIEEWLVQAVMALFARAKTHIQTSRGDSENFDVKVDVKSSPRLSSQSSPLHHRNGCHL